MAISFELTPVGAAASRSALPATEYGRDALSSRSTRLFSRMRDILAANLTDMLDHSDTPEKMIRMIICEMEETLVHVRASTARTIADQKELKGTAGALERLAGNWREKAELALLRDRDDLARQALVEKAKAEERAAEIGEEIAVLGKALGANHADITKLEDKLREACSKRDRIRTRLESAQNSIRLRELLNGGAMQDAFARFDQLERVVDEAEGHAEAAALGRDEEDEADPVRDARIEAELAEMRKSAAR
jgi:phage shock protein A